MIMIILNYKLLQRKINYQKYVNFHYISEHKGEFCLWKTLQRLTELDVCVELKSEEQTLENFKEIR